MPKITHSGASNAAEQSIPPAPQPEEKTDYASLTKMELVELAKDSGLQTAGTKADLVDRLEASDGVAGSS